MGTRLGLKLWSVVGILGVGGALTLAVRHHTAHGAEHATRSASAAAPQALSMWGDSARSYGIDFSTRVATSTGQLMTGFQLSGPLALSARHTANGVVVDAQFAGSLRSDTSAPGTDPDTAAQQLSAAAHRPFQLQFDEHGTLVFARGEPGTPPFIGRIWTALGEYLQLSSSPGGARWQARENDASGAYSAQYDDAGNGQISKRKLRYDSLVTQSLKSYEVVTSSARFELESDELKSVELSEDLRATFNEGAPLPGFEGVTKLRLSRRSDSAASVAPLVSAVPFDQLARQERDAAIDQQLMNKMTLAEALTEVQAFEQIGHDKAKNDAAGRAFSTLTALLRRDPSALAAVRQRLAKDGPLAGTLLAALRDASTPETQKLLSELAGPKSPLGDVSRLEAARSLSLVMTPTTDTVGTLEQLRTDPLVGVQATYGLGTALGRLGKSDPETATQIRQTLTTQLSGTSDAGSQAAVLTSFGNAGDPATLDVIRAYVVNPEPRVRAAAAQALRHIPGQDADALLVRLCADANEDVRYSALDAVGERTPSQVLIATVASLIVAESALRPRVKAVNIAARWYPSAPDLRPSLQLVASNDTNADLRNIAKVALERS
ncbi:MAG TPA: HEAT repeat domain-containing protein [Polyangiaceae bacterium]|nr:HEAT repeat domain-containing protein [Polyangiaceae bacterium]